MKEKLYKALDRQVANLSVLFTKLHHYHWYVTGPNFFALHAKFEELYDHINELYDEFAERLLTIGGKPSSTQKAYLELATLKEATGIETAMDMVKGLLSDFELIVKELKEDLKIAQALEDEATADLYIGSIAEFEKTIWMLKFTLK
ncbi:MAG: Dps family protein [Acholeplasmataceae bacterium]